MIMPRRVGAGRREERVLGFMDLLDLVEAGARWQVDLPLTQELMDRVDVDAVHTGHLLVEGCRTLNRYPDMARPLLHSARVTLHLLDRIQTVQVVITVPDAVWQHLPTEDEWVATAMADVDMLIRYGH